MSSILGERTMKAFDRELDELEETIVYLALVFLTSSILGALFRSTIPIVWLVARLAASLSFAAGFVAISIWTFRRFASPIYNRFQISERNNLQGLSINHQSPTTRDKDS